MTTINLIIQGASATATVNGILTSGMVGVPINFDFDSVWDGLTKIAVFRAGGTTRSVVGIGSSTTIPWEVLKMERHMLYIGVCGTNEEGTIVIPTIWAEACRIDSGADPSADESTDYTKPVYQQMLDKVNESIDDLKRKIENGELNGKPGAQGERGYSGLVPRVSIPWSSNITVQCGDMSEIATLAGATTVTFGAEVPGYDAEWDFVVRQGSTAYQLTLPAIEWGFGSAPTFAANTSTVCRVYKSDGVFCGEWSCRRTQ